MTKSKQIFVSNRLPFSIDPKTGELRRGTGGLVSALLGVTLDEPFWWLGFETDELNACALAKKSAEISPHLHLHPVILEKKLYDSYYDQFCNDVFWPLFHYEGQYTFFQREHWDSYVTANQKMAEEILKIARPEDTVWIHDFHFLLLPQYLKEASPRLKVGLFLHIPFPSAEIFRQLPVRHEILTAMTKCDLLGFQEHSYLRHFTVSLKTHLGIESTFFKADLGDHTLHMGVYPISIDVEGWREKSRLVPEKSELIFQYLGIDRLDYTKGIELKLNGFRRLMQKYPALQGHVSLLQVAIPTRVNVPSYMKLKNEIEQLVGQINGEFGKAGYTPVNYIFNSVGEEELLDLYKNSDCLTVTSKRDGMNLVAMEYIISQPPSNPGVLIISEFAGVSSLLGQALIINPWDEDAVADAMHAAFSMPLEERIERRDGLDSILSKYSATQWAKSFLDDLDSTFQEQRRQSVFRLSALREQWPLRLHDKIKSARKIKLILDYDGTLLPIKKRPELAVVNCELLNLLNELRKEAEIYIISGRSKDFLDQQFPISEFFLAAEHGAFLRPPGQEWASRLSSDINTWYLEVERVMNAYQDRVPLSTVEKKEASIVWHFRQSPEDFAEFQARKLDEELQVGLANQPVSITIGSKIVEAKAIECNKGNLVRQLLESDHSDSLFVCIGDDRTDEDMFKVISAEHVSVKVGIDSTHAHFRFLSQSEVQVFLTEILKLRQSLPKDVVELHPHREPRKIGFATLIPLQ